MRELNIGEKVYYVARDHFKIRSATIIKKTIEMSIDNGRHMRVLSYLVQDVATATIVDKGEALVSTSSWVTYAFTTREELINYLTRE